MPPFAGARAGERDIRRGARLMETRYQILWQEWAISRYADKPFDGVRIRSRPIETCKDAGEGTREIRHAVGDHGQAGIGKARGISIRVDNDAAALRREASEHALQDARTADFYARLVAATHATR